MGNKKPKSTKIEDGHAGLVESREKLRERLFFEQLLSEISSEFSGADNGCLDELITDALGRISECLGSDLTTFMQLNRETGLIQHTHQWVAADITLDVDFTNHEFDIYQSAPWVAHELTKLEPITVSCVDDFPKAAAKEVAICESTGIKSIAWVPISVTGIFSGCIVLNAIRHEITWPEPLIRRVRLLGEIVANALRRSHSESLLSDHVEFESRVTQIAASMVNASHEQIDELIEEGLGIIGEFLGTHLGLLLLYNENSQTYEVTHQWKGAQAKKVVNLRNILVDQSYPWIARQLRGQHLLIISSLVEFPDDAKAEREICERFGIRSMAFIPFDVSELPKGFINLSALVNKFDWNKSIIQRIQLVGEIFCNALDRHDTEQKLNKAYFEIKELKEKLEAENIVLRENVGRAGVRRNIIGDSEPIKRVLKQVEQVAPTNATVLLLGDTGVGKELIAHEIHALSSRNDRLMVTVNCATLPASLVEAELFGREKGAYTGASNKMIGRFEIAHESTIFLDEIGELPLDLQAKLLRVIQEGEFERLGSTKTIQVDVRIIAATNRKLEQAVSDGDFREDLYYRLNVFPITVPSLHDRVDDIAPMVAAFTKEISDSMGKRIEHISEETIRKLESYPWPGNVRELKNFIERAIIMAPDSTLRVDLPKKQPMQTNGPVSLADAEKECILNALDRAAWQISGAGGAARILGLQPTTLRSKMEKLQIKKPH